RATAIIEYDDFRGKEKHEIEAWFCPEIPFSYGPDIYYGLPGLIFEANYVNSKVKFYLKSIVKLDSQIPLTLPNENAITEEEFTAIFNAEMKKLTEEN
ncbi:MAG: GLPGLI family protein, partial [Flavobacterium sp.]|uniref:GLPGLI family protein n=1 Tax=Flavobacterium sp. TaxID=239 RepID=UPI0025C42E9D